MNNSIDNNENKINVKSNDCNISEDMSKGEISTHISSQNCQNDNNRDEDNFIDGCSSTTGASENKDSPLSLIDHNDHIPKGFSNKLEDINVDNTNGDNNSNRDISKNEIQSENKKETINPNSVSNINYLMKQKALDKANVFLQWNLTPNDQQMRDFLDMVNGKLNLSMISERGYDHCLLYFELLRDGLVGEHIWGDTDVDFIIDILYETKLTLENGNISSPVKKIKRSDSFSNNDHTNNENNDNNNGNKNNDNTSSKLSDIGFDQDDLNNIDKDENSLISNKEFEATDELECNDDSLETNSTIRQDSVNRLLNPKSGCKGVSWSNRQMAWLAFWKEDNQRRSKTFSARKLGFEEAQRRAIEFLRYKREEVRIKTQAHLYEELPRVCTSALSNHSDNLSSNNTPSSNYRNKLIGQSTPSSNFDLDNNSQSNILPAFDEATRNILSNTQNSNINNINLQQNVLSNIGQSNILAAAAASQQIGIPFNMTPFSSMNNGFAVDPSIAAAFAAATTMSLGMANNSNPNNINNQIQNFPATAIPNPFFMFGASVNSPISQNSNFNPGANMQQFIPWASYMNGNLIQNSKNLFQQTSLISNNSLINNQVYSQNDESNDLKNETDTNIDTKDNKAIGDQQPIKV